MTTARRKLIVNADDFGLSLGVNRGIIASHEQGIVTSASLMVRGPAASEAAEYARGHPTLSVGLHIDLGEWLFQNDRWEPLYEVVSLDDAASVEEEVSRQLAQFYALMGRLPTHLDSHQHVHQGEPIRSVVTTMADALRVPLRHRTRGIRYVGDFYGQTGKGLPLPQATSVGSLVRILGALAPGTSELACHPGFGDNLETVYRSERAEEVRTLCDEQVRTTLAAQQIQLCSFHDIKAPQALYED